MVTWQIASSLDADYIFELAKLKGWAENKVQVKRLEGMDGDWYYVIEPYEETCTCPSLIRYDDYINDPVRAG